MAFFLWTLIAVAAPAVTAGPDLQASALEVKLPITHVTVFSDRARITRSAKVKFEDGIQTLRLPDLPGAAMLDTIRVGCRGGRVIRVESAPIQKEKISIDQVEELIDKLRSLDDEKAAIYEQQRILEQELNLLSGISPLPAVDESKRPGKAAPAVLPEMWKKVIQFVMARSESIRKKLQALAVERRDLVEKSSKVQREVKKYDLGAFTDRRIRVLAIVDAKKPTTARLDLEYFIPGASWVPTYDVNFDAQKGKVRINTAGLVVQASGEDWDDVSLHLSTAIPGRGIDMPELLTWALSEQREFIPRPRPARAVRQARLLPPPQPLASRSEQEHRARLGLLKRQIAELERFSRVEFDARLVRGQTIDGAPTSGKAAVKGKERPRRSRYDFKDRTISGELARPEEKYLMERKKAEYRSPPPPPAPVMATVPLADSAPMEEECEEVAARDSGPSGPPVMPTSLGLFESGGYRGPVFSDHSLPAVVAGGLDYVYDCPTRQTVPSTGQRLRVPLDVQTYPVETFYEATPSLKKTAYLKAVVVNRGERPILAGSANIFVQGDFSGQGQLATTGPGGKIELPLGADEDIRILHKVVPKTVTEGVFSKDDVTTYINTIELGNYKKRPMKIVVFDQVPKTNNEDIEIELGKVTPKQTEGPDEDGVLRWEIDIPAGQIRTIEFRYTVTRPQNWQLTQ